MGGASLWTNMSPYLWGKTEPVNTKLGRDEAPAASRWECTIVSCPSNKTAAAIKRTGKKGLWTKSIRHFVPFFPPLREDVCRGLARVTCRSRCLKKKKKNRATRVDCQKFKRVRSHPKKHSPKKRMKQMRSGPDEQANKKVLTIARIEMADFSSSGGDHPVVPQHRRWGAVPERRVIRREHPSPRTQLLFWVRSPESIRDPFSFERFPPVCVWCCCSRADLSGFRNAPVVNTSSSWKNRHVSFDFGPYAPKQTFSFFLLTVDIGERCKPGAHEARRWQASITHQMRNLHQTAAPPPNQFIIFESKSKLFFLNHSFCLPSCAHWWRGKSYTMWLCIYFRRVCLTSTKDLKKSIGN